MNSILLTKATKDDESPTQGWELQMIIKMTKKSNEISSSVLNWLLRRLKTSSPHVKYKVLNIINVLCEKGNSAIASEVAQKTHEIKQYASYKGKRDPIHGDLLNIRIREAADKTINSVFARVDKIREEQTELQNRKSYHNNNAGIGSSYQNGIQSMNNRIGTYSGISSKGETIKPSKYTGISSENSSNVKCKKSKWKVSMRNVDCQCPKCRAEKYRKTGLYQNNSKRVPLTQYKNYGTEENTNTVYTPPSTLITQTPKIRKTEEFETEIVKQPRKIHKNTWISENKSTDEENFASERNLVKKFISSGKGTRITMKELSKFVKSASTMRIEKICYFLNNELKNRSWSLRLRTLYAIEKLIDTNESAKSFFQNKMDLIGSQTESIQVSIKKLSIKILEKLSGEAFNIQEEVVEENKKKPVSHNLLGFLEEPTIDHNIKKERSMFDGMEVNESTFKSPMEGGLLFDDSKKTKQKKIENNQTGFSMDDFFNVKKTNNQTKASTETKVKLDDIFGFEEISQKQTKQFSPNSTQMKKKKATPKTEKRDAFEKLLDVI